MQLQTSIVMGYDSCIAQQGLLCYFLINVFVFFVVVDEIKNAVRPNTAYKLQLKQWNQGSVEAELICSYNPYGAMCLCLLLSRSVWTGLWLKVSQRLARRVLQ